MRLTYRRKFVRVLALTGLIVVGPLGGCMSVSERTGLTSDKGFNLATGEQTVGLGTEVSTTERLVWCEAQNRYATQSIDVAVRHESASQTLANLGTAAGGAGLLTLGIKGVDSSSSASANATANNAPPRLPQ